MGCKMTPRITPKDAVQRAYEYFDDFYQDCRVKHRLLEGVRYDEQDNAWVVTIGFDLGRESRVGLPSLFDDKREPIREFRIIRLRADDGSFVELDHV